MNREKFLVTTAIGLLFFPCVTAQTVNTGQLVIMPKTEMSTLLDLENKESGIIINDGVFYIYKNYHNDGLFEYTTNRTTGYTVFENNNQQVQLLSGQRPSSFFDVLFDNKKELRAFDLKNDFSVSGTANFLNGVVKVDSLDGAMVFQKNATTINVSNNSYAEGEVEKIGNKEFTFPVGDAGFYRRVKIGAPTNMMDSFLGKYYLKNSNAGQPHQNKNESIKFIDNKEYWTINKNGATSDIVLTLSWDEQTTSKEITNKESKNLKIVRWDEAAKIWVDEGGIVNFEDKTVTTITQVGGYGIFTLALGQKDIIPEDTDKIIVYNAVSPNGDGDNDYFFIENIQKHPNNTVEIYNRWGVKVFETKNYDSSGNVFRGVSDGRSTFKKDEKLPTGTYYYILKYELMDQAGSRMEKQAGYLHLENK
ncbi:gliding motility-associated C-terminal domain-containing protein [Flavobacterium sp. HSC-61S13]|uniref:gliding motility-associated C-terminal domain-containing protein n=1 Tax=Flavobacterium sp. HSC-61S13 TaxID=2910963 RepID=UPI0020A0BE4E|nr:gliding motility-associated C-terminal domain-containing protein [Flavobacterium sp. HSC-61S13]MCP1996776.1 gliding motility-associated-like protein [Flavobacterium sp. HSC-61S13]